MTTRSLDSVVESDTYQLLTEMAEAKLRGNFLKTKISKTSLVHDSLLKLGDNARRKIQTKKHFVALMSYVMRSVLVDKARKCERERKVVAQVNYLQSKTGPATSTTQNKSIRLHQALLKLSEFDYQTGMVVQLRVFLGFGFAQIAEQLDISERSAERFWAYGKAWLKRELISGE